MKYLFRFLLTALVATVASSTWASSTTYYAKLTATVAKESSGMGKVYAGTSKTASSYDASSMSANNNSTTQNDGLTFYASAQANDGYEFTGWSDTDGGTVNNTENPRTVTVKASSTTEGSPSTTTIFANFELKTLTAFAVTYLAPQNGSYTVDGTAVGSGGLTSDGHTEVYKPRLVATAASGYAFNGWYTTIDGGATKTPLAQGTDYTASFTAAATVGADFVPCVPVTTAEELTQSLADNFVTEIPAGTTISLPSGTLASGKTLIVNGNLLLSGTFTNNGTITGGGTVTLVKYTVTQGCASGDTPFETICATNTYNKKYYKTEIGTLSGKVSGTGTKSCTVQNGARVVRNGAVIAECAWPSSATPAVLCCTIDSTKAVNCITGFMNPCYDADAAKGMATMKKNAQPTKQMLVLLATKKLDNSACSSGGLLATVGNYQKMQGNFGTMDLAGSTLTISPSYIDNYTHTLLNGGISVTTLMYSGTLTCINLSSLSITKLKEDYASVINIYDCNLGSTKVPKAYNGSNANKNKVNFYSSGSYTYSTSSNFHTLNPKTVYKIYGGIWNGEPGSDYNGAGSDYGFYPTSEGATTYSLQLKTDQTVVTFDNGDKYESLADAFAALPGLAASSVKMTMVKNATLASAVTVPAGKTVEIELDGCCITAANGFVINNGTFLIGDRRGSIAAEGGRVITSAGKFLQNNGTAEVTYGYYTGDVVLNGGVMTTHYGRFTGNFTAATGVDKTAVADFRGGYFDKDVSSFLRPGYYRTSGYVGAFPKPALTKTFVNSNGGYWKVNAKLLSPADDAIYTTSSTTKEGYLLDNWKRRGEIISMVTPYYFNTIDVAVGFDRTTTKDGVYCNIAKPSLGANQLTDTVQGGELYRVLSEQLAHPTNPMLSPSSQKKYTDVLTDSTYKEMEFGVYSTKDVDKGTTVNLRIDLCTGSSGTDITNLRSVYALMSESAVIGSGDLKKAMIQPASGAATFYATIAEAVAACPNGGTVKLCNDVTATDAVTVAKKSITIDTNGFVFNGTVVPGRNCTLTTTDVTPTIETYLGKTRRVFTVTYVQPPFIFFLR